MKQLEWQSENFVGNAILVVSKVSRDRCGRDRMVVGFTTTCHVQSAPITTKVVSLNPIHGEVYLIQHYVIKFVK